MSETLKIPTRWSALKQLAAEQGRYAAVFPIHYPRALLRAFGLQPVEVWGPPGKETTLGDAHLQAYTCSIVRCGLSFIKAGALDAAALILVPHACDSLQGLGSTLLDFAETPAPVETLYLPRGRRESDVQFLAEELKRLAAALARVTGQEPTEDELLQAAKREEAADAALAALLEARPGLALSNRELYRLARSREYLPAEVFEPLCREAAAAAPVEDRGGPRVVLSGLVPEPMDMLDVLDDAGVMVAADDMACLGRRLYPAGEGDEPYLRMARALQGGAPDATLGCSVDDRIAHLVRLCRGSGATGVVHYDIKFCEPEQFYLPQVNKGLSSEGLKTLSVEVDLADPLPDQVVTRLEAFAETLP